MLFDLAKAISEDVSRAAEQLKLGSQNGDTLLTKAELQTLLQSALRKCDLVSREEFDTQALVLARTRQKLEHLEQQLQQLETGLKAQQ